MPHKPTLQDFMRDNPGKGLNDYYDLYGDPPAPPANEPSETDRPRRYLPKSKKERPRMEFFNLLASLALVAAYFLPWFDAALLAALPEGIADTTVKGWGLPSFFQAAALPDFSEASHITAHLIPLGGLLAALGELLRSWQIRSAGQVLALSFAGYWGYKLSVLARQSPFAPEDLPWAEFLQYGLFITAAVALSYVVDIIRTFRGGR